MLETLSNRKLSILTIFLLILQVIFYLIGGIIGHKMIIYIFLIYNIY